MRVILLVERCVDLLAVLFNVFITFAIGKHAEDISGIDSIQMNFTDEAYLVILI